MRHYTFILLISFPSLFCFGQKKTEIDKITKFKNNYLRKAKLNHADTLYLDSLTLVREKQPEGRLIKTVYNKKNFILHEYYYDKTTQVKSIFEYDSINRPIGLSRHYTRKGVLEYTQDYEKGEWTVYDSNNYPFYDLQKAVKVKADSLISRMYGHSFLLNHTVWIVGGSYISNEKGRQRWTSQLKSVPTKFEFCYKVRLDSQKTHEGYIYFDLDAKGNFLPDYQERGFIFHCYGFENVPENNKGSFRLNYSEALLRAKSFGLTETDSSKAFGLLYWESFRKLNIINGQFRFYIAIKTKVDQSNSNGRFYRTTKYNVYVFNPWTAEFVELKKMKTDYWSEKDRSRGTGLMPDKE